MPISKPLEVYGVSFASLSELCRVLGYSKPLSGTTIKAQYGDSLERVADVRLQLSGLEPERRAAVLREAKTTYLEGQKGVKRTAPAAYSIVALKAAIRLAVTHITPADLETACTISGGPIEPAQLQKALSAYAKSLDFEAAKRELKKF